MKTEDAIKNRRSIRKYTLQVHKNADIQKIINAAILALSGLNNQPWKFKILKDKKINYLNLFAMVIL